MSIKCSCCIARSLTFSTSVVGKNSKQPLLNIALQVAFVCAGCMHANYTKVLEKALRMCTAAYVPTLQSIEEAKDEMKAMDPSELGSWEHAVTCGNAADLGITAKTAIFTFTTT